MKIMNKENEQKLSLNSKRGNAGPRITKKPKTWMITGACRGFGLEISKAVLSSGDNVVATDRTKPVELVKKLNYHVNLHVAMLDIHDELRAVKVADEAVERFGSIDVLVNSAEFSLLGGVEETSDAEVRRVYETNVFGLLKVIRAVLPHMRRQRSGHVINFSSVDGLAGVMGWGIHCSTKFAIEGITEALAKELAPLGIFATAVEPGGFCVNFLDGTSETMIPDYAGTAGFMRQFVTEVDDYQPPGDPVKLAAAIVRLAASPKPPVHLPLGNDALKCYGEKSVSFEEEIAEWRDVITTTDRDDVEAF
jgi:NAD(P)-dependent dehydrogenase (short-subunit alcohol dehydrogenase family)